jgi:hypothetical protein
MKLDQMCVCVWFCLCIEVFCELFGRVDMCAGFGSYVLLRLYVITRARATMYVRVSNLWNL